MKGNKDMLTEGEVAPDFELEDGDGKTWRLAELNGKKVVLYFYPADDTPGCTKEACDFRDTQGAWRDAGYVILGVSPQSAASHTRFASKYSLNFPLLVDADLDVAKRYGALREAPEEWEGQKLHVKRCTFVIDEGGRIEQALYGVTAKGHVESLRVTLGV
jgi:thioredoxin-dependent peroxiredoxin